MRVHRDKERERRKAVYAKKKAEGKGIEPACKKPPADGRIRCRPCHKHYLDLTREWQRKYRGPGSKRA